MKIYRHKTKTVKIGDVNIGGNNPIAIQSMAKVKTADIDRAIKQIKGLEVVGCEIVRVAVKDNADAKALRDIKQGINIPLVADIHFDWRLAIKAIDSGVDKIRLNPGNIYKIEHVREIAKAAKLACIPIRVGLNSGSLPGIRKRKPRVRDVAHDMVEGALDYIRILEGFKFYDIVVSLKGSNIFDTIEAYRKMTEVCDYPLHLGVTAGGPTYSGTIKSSIALGVLLLEGIGDTIRISLTDNPKQEVKTAKTILEAVDLRSFGPEIISCPTCGRCEVDLVKVVSELENRISDVNHKSSAHPIKLAIMGCMVNGPGEARDADIGIAFGRKEGLLFRKGKSVKKVSFVNCIDTLSKAIKK